MFRFDLFDKFEEVGTQLFFVLNSQNIVGEPCHIHLTFEDRRASDIDRLIGLPRRLVIGISRDESHERIVDLFGGHALDTASAEIVRPAIGHGFGRIGFVLEHLRQHQRLLEVAQAVALFLHQLGQMRRNLRRMGILRLQVVVARLEIARSHDASPHSIRDHPGKPLLGSLCHPLGQPLPPVVAFMRAGHARRLAKGSPRPLYVAGSRILVFVVRRQSNTSGPPTAEAVAVDIAPKHPGCIMLDAVLRHGVHFAKDWIEQILLHGLLSVGESSETEEIFLLCVAKGVVVALGAFHAGPEEDAHGHREIVEGHPAIAGKIADCRALFIPTAPFCGQQFGNHTVPRHILIDGIAHPVAINRVTNLRDIVLVDDPKTVEHPICQMAGIPWRLDQRRHEVSALVWVFIGEESGGFFHGWNAPDSRQIGPA